MDDDPADDAIQPQAALAASGLGEPPEPPALSRPAQAAVTAQTRKALEACYAEFLNDPYWLSRLALIAAAFCRRKDGRRRRGRPDIQEEVQELIDEGNRFTACTILSSKSKTVIWDGP